MRVSKTKELGLLGEQQAKFYFEQQGFDVIGQNYRTKRGEIDLIAQKNNLIVFIEVKTRSSHYFHTSHVITHSKQRKMTLVAKDFMQKHDVQDCILRFDVIIIHPYSEAKLEHIENAFYAC